MTKLADELKAMSAASQERIPAPMRAVMEEATASLEASGIEGRALKAGDIAPDFALPGPQGRHVRLAERLATGPVVLTFYRGGWCPYCNLELKAYQRRLPDFSTLGARIIAISPETPDHSLTTAEKNALTFDVLSDVGSEVAAAYGLNFTLAAPLQDLYRKFGNDLAARNGASDWQLPVPATFVIAPDRKIVLASASADYRERLEPDVALEAVRKLAHVAAG